MMFLQCTEGPVAAGSIIKIDQRPERFGPQIFRKVHIRYGGDRVITDYAKCDDVNDFLAAAVHRIK